MDLINIMFLAEAGDLDFFIENFDMVKNAAIGIVSLVGGTTIISIATFIKTSVSGKKFTKVSDFAVVANESIKFAKTEITKAKDQIVAETRVQIVEPLMEQVNALRADNAQLTTLTVTLLSYVPLPAAYKKEALAVLNTLGVASAQALELLAANIANQEEQEAQEAQVNEDLNKDIGEI